MSAGFNAGGFQRGGERVAVMPVDIAIADDGGFDSGAEGGDTFSGLRKDSVFDDDIIGAFGEIDMDDRHARQNGDSRPGCNTDND